MNKLQVTGIALAVGAASMFALAPAFAADEAAAAPMIKCEGVMNAEGTAVAEFKTQKECDDAKAAKAKDAMDTKKAE